MYGICHKITSLEDSLLPSFFLLLAAAAVLAMGEKTEQTPAAIANDVHNAVLYNTEISLDENSRYSWVSPRIMSIPRF